MKDITFKTRDGVELHASLFEAPPDRETGPVVLISSATAVPRRFYRHFARFLADDGARAVMTYDYRGINGKLSQSELRSIRMSDWATADLPAAAETLCDLFPGAPLAGMGHSFGGQALGLSGAASRFVRYMTIAAGSGYLGFTREHQKLSNAMNRVGWPVAAVLGRLPRWAGFGEPLPYGAFNQWRKWCNSPEYFMSDETVPERSRFRNVAIPMVAVGFEDDNWATRQSVDAMVAWYSHAEIRVRWFGEDELTAPVGHFGFFRTEHRETLWPQLADWLVRD